MAPRTSALVRSLRALLTVFVALVAVIAQQVSTETPAAAAATWNDGMPAYSTILNCPSIIGGYSYSEYGLGVGLGASVDVPAKQPIPGQTFLVKVIMTTVGYPCSGNYVDVQFKLPSGVSTAIAGTDKIKCFYKGSPLPADQCPTSLTAGSESGYLKLPAPPATGSQVATLWPVPVGQTIEFHVPVRATQAMTNAQVQGRMHVLDGNSSPVLRPTVGITVYPKPSDPVTPPGSPTGVTATAGIERATVKWSAPANPGSSPIASYVITPYRNGIAQPSTSAAAAARTIDLSGLDAGSSYTFRVAAVSAAGTSPPSSPSNAVTPAAPPVVKNGMVFVPIDPCRVFDSRATSSGAFQSGVARSIAITGAGTAFAAQGGTPGGCGIPFGAAAVEGSISAVAPAGRGFLRAYPSGTTMPGATFVNFDGGRAVTNTGALTLRTNGSTQLDIVVLSSKADVVVDVQGYFVPQSMAGMVFVPIAPCRIADTRVGGGALGPSVEREFHVTGGGPGFTAQGGTSGGCAIPVGAGAVEASISAVGATSPGFTRVWPAGRQAPNATFLNHGNDGSITNTGAVSISGGFRQLSVRNFASTSHYVIDIQGYFVAESGAPVTATRFTPLTPCRIVDTRLTSAGRFTNGHQRRVAVAGGSSVFAAQGGKAGGCGIPANATAIEASLSAVDPSTSGYVRTWPSAGLPAAATFLNFVGARAVTNTGAVAVQPSTVDGLTVRSFGGPTDLVVDVQGYYAPS